MDRQDRVKSEILHLCGDRFLDLIVELVFSVHDLFRCHLRDYCTYTAGHDVQDDSLEFLVIFIKEVADRSLQALI